jgi:hypothetical protein
MTRAELWGRPMIRRWMECCEQHPDWRPSGSTVMQTVCTPSFDRSIPTRHPPSLTVLETDHGRDDVGERLAIVLRMAARAIESPGAMSVGRIVRADDHKTDPTGVMPTISASVLPPNVGPRLLELLRKQCARASVDRRVERK